jgi:hypothetical protein
VTFRVIGHFEKSNNAMEENEEFLRPSSSSASIPAHTFHTSGNDAFANFLAGNTPEVENSVAVSAPVGVVGGGEKRKASDDLDVEEDGGLQKCAKLDDQVLVYCNKCPALKFTNMRSLTRHVKTTHKDQVQVAGCGFCDLIFDSSNELTTHVKTRHRANLLAKCPLCSFIGDRPATLEEHRLSYHEGAPFYPCDFCNRDFTNIMLRQEHEKTEHLQQMNEIYCHHCDKVVGDKLKQLRYHYRTCHKGLIEFPCTLCESSFAKKDYLLDHEHHFHPNQLPERHSFVSQDRLVCPFVQVANCVYTAQWPRPLRLHVQDKHLTLKCPECSANYSSRAALKHHLTVNHPALSESLLEYYWKCGICKEAFTDEATKGKHVTDAHVGEQHSCRCAVCGDIFTFESEKVKHLEDEHLKNVSDVQTPEHFLIPPTKLNAAVEDSDNDDDDDDDDDDDNDAEADNTDELAMAGQNGLNQDHQHEMSTKTMIKIRGDEQLPFQCSECSLSFKFYLSLIFHLRLDHEGRNLANDPAEPETILKEAQPDHHGVKSEPMDPDTLSFPCQYCESQFFNEEHRTWHYETAHSVYNSVKVVNEPEILREKKREAEVEEMQLKRRLKIKIVVKKNAPIQGGQVAAR